MKKYIHIKSLMCQATVCGKPLGNSVETFTQAGAAEAQRGGRVLCPKCAKAKQKKQTELF